MAGCLFLCMCSLKLCFVCAVTNICDVKFSLILTLAIPKNFRYYLSRFKDSTRQGTIDMMLGNYVSEDEFNESKASQYEEDSIATAEHVKLLIEDCKKMLINQPEQVVGAWGLINADPSSGDPNETEMDSILILTKDSYFIADYDDQFDKVTKYQRVYLHDLTLLEFGMGESTSSLFKTSKPKYCIRLNYKVNNVSGYYHMFRSTNLRFFNNMAVVIKNIDEEVESLKAICEAFIVAMDIASIHPVPLKQGQALDRRKSKVINTGTSSSIYLDIASLPQMTRNVSESQLLSLKNVGTKALSNMSQQFSKLNRISHSFKQNKSIQKPNFSIGQQRKNDSSSDSDEDYENSIFQPNESVQDGTSLQYATDSSCERSNNSIEQGLEVTEDSFVPPTNKDTFLPGVGIVMGNKNDTNEVEGVLEEKQNLLSRVDSAQLDDVQLSSIMQNVSISSGKNSNPEIQINSDDLDVSKKIPPNSLKLEKRFSHSSGNVNDSDVAEFKPSDTKLERSSSDYEVQLNISQSQSESALRNKFSGVNSPVASATKDLVLSPFNKLAKGVQSFGANLDPRKLSGHGQVRQVTEREMEEHRKLQERWQNSKTRLIAL